jgi:hypothetical protein
MAPFGSPHIRVIPTEQSSRHSSVVSKGYLHPDPCPLTSDRVLFQQKKDPVGPARVPTGSFTSGERRGVERTARVALGDGWRRGPAVHSNVALPGYAKRAVSRDGLGSPTAATFLLSFTLGPRAGIPGADSSHCTGASPAVHWACQRATKSGGRIPIYRRSPRFAADSRSPTAGGIKKRAVVVRFIVLPPL